MVGSYWLVAGQDNRGGHHECTTAEADLSLAPNRGSLIALSPIKIQALTPLASEPCVNCEDPNHELPRLKLRQTPHRYRQTTLAAAHRAGQK